MSSAKSRITQRRQINQRIAAEDKANRCALCRRSFFESGQIMEDFMDPRRFCSLECMEQALAETKA